jgi:hypothetical protein
MCARFAARSRTGAPSSGRADCAWGAYRVSALAGARDELAASNASCHLVPPAGRVHTLTIAQSERRSPGILELKIRIEIDNVVVPPELVAIDHQGHRRGEKCLCGRADLENCAGMCTPKPLA